MNQCKSPPVLAALQEMEVLAVRLWYPGFSVEVNVSGIENWGGVNENMTHVNALGSL